MMNITKTMVLCIKKAIPLLSTDRVVVEIPDMSGYFITNNIQFIPEKAARFANIGIDGVTYFIYIKTLGGS